MGRIRRLVLDVLKPHEPSIVQLARLISDLPGIEGVNISIFEIDRKVENAKITVEGTDISDEEVFRLIRDEGATIHSVDEAVAGRIMIDDAETPQDS